jgi:hypothetical protein
MAKDVYDPTTWSEWLLLREVLQIVEAHCLAEQAAAELVLRYANQGHFRRVCRAGDELIWPEHWVKSVHNVSYPVDFTNSRVVYVREPISSYSPIGARQDMLREAGFLPSAPHKVMTLVRLHRDDVASMLRSVGLLPARPAVELAVTSLQELGGTERWVYEAMKSDPPREGDRRYVRNLWQRRPDKRVAQKTIQNLVGKYRKQLEVPAEVPAGKSKSARKR